MADETNADGAGEVPVDPRDDPEDAAALRRYAVELADGVQAALAPWVVRSVMRVHALWVEAQGAGARAADEAALRAEAERAGATCAQEIGAATRSTLLRDIDEQRVNPLAVVRGAVAYPTAVLRAAGVPPLQRDQQAEARFPEDDYDLSPASFRDLDPALHEPGLRWGAAKAHVHLHRHRR